MSAFMMANLAAVIFNLFIAALLLSIGNFIQKHVSFKQFMIAVVEADVFIWIVTYLHFLA